MPSLNSCVNTAGQAIAENARVAQNQEEYSIRYEALSARFQETKDKYDAVATEIASPSAASGGGSSGGSSTHWRPCRRW